MKKDLKAFTIVDRRSSRTHILGFSHAFTMAEILISLTIIGIVAAITLPALMTNINEKAWNAQRKALHARLSQAIGTMDKLNGYDDALDFVNNALSSSISLTSVCGPDKVSQCGLPSNFFGMDGSNYNMVDHGLLGDGTASARTANGESIFVYYNSECMEPVGNVFDIHDPVCLNLIYDLNGIKGPNTMGKDMGFMTALYPTNSVVVAPMPAYIASSSYSLDDAEDAVFGYDSNTRLPNKNELISIGINGAYLSEYYFADENDYWSSTADSSNSDLNFCISRNYDITADKKTASKKIIGIMNDNTAPKSFNASLALTEDGVAVATCSQTNKDLCTTSEMCESAGGSWNTGINDEHWCSWGPK